MAGVLWWGLAGGMALMAQPHTLEAATVGSGKAQSSEVG